MTCAFWPEGHLVIEALAYRSLVEGHDGQPARPDVLRDLINDGALVPPICFGSPSRPSEDCRKSASPPNQYHLQAGSRLGMTWSAGMVDMLVQAPTLAWQVRPFDTGEILSLSVAIRVSPSH